MFDVFGSVWFAAIYLLLFISLVGCLIPRIRVHARAVARKPLPAPRNLVAAARVGLVRDRATPPDGYAAARPDGARPALAGRRGAPRTPARVTLSAEKGYSRETGNLIFHVALLVALVLIAVGRLYSYEGSAIVRQGPGLLQHRLAVRHAGSRDASPPRARCSPAPFCIDQVDKFTATYTSPASRRSSRADVTLLARPSTAPRREQTTITVNHPLRLEGDRVYLIGHGFAPTVTVRMPDGTTPARAPPPSSPRNGTTLYSEGVFKLTGRPGAKQDVGISGFFAPTPLDTGNGVITSSSPQVNNPVLGIFVYDGDLNCNGPAASRCTRSTPRR